MSGIKWHSTLLGNKSDALAVIGMVGILAVLFTPLPPLALDFLLICNLSIALLVLLLTFYSDKPLSFSTFPSILLITTLFRLALNISATRLILDDADAGKVIGAIGSYVVGGNYVVGVVVFVILIVVQYVVVTNGAQRVAEVAARFTLDSMPGKQMSIDADLNMGAIDEAEAKSRREEIQQEANFYGAMDGATKFVKGDAIAGIVIIFIDIVAGLTMGVGHHGMSWSEALQSYTLLTVGDGIVTQIPSLVIATATGIIITRAATDAKLGTEVIEQIAAHPGTLFILSVILFFTFFLPDLPSSAIFVAFLIASAAAFYSYRRKRAVDLMDRELLDENGQLSDGSSGKEDIYKQIMLSAIEVKIGPGLSEAVEAKNEVLYERIQNVRKQFALELGVVIPKVKLATEKCGVASFDYQICFYGAQIGRGELRPERILAISSGVKSAELDGIKTKEPTYGLPAIWIDKELAKQARSLNYTIVDWETVLITHFSELIRRNAHELLSRSEVENILDKHKQNCAGLLEEIVPTLLSLTEIQRVLQALVKEQVSIRNIELILEVLAEKGREIKDPEELAELVRKRLGISICQHLASDESSLEVITLEPTLERFLISNASAKDKLSSFQIDPSTLERIITSVMKSCQKMMAENRLPVLLCSPSIRRRLKQVTERVIPKLSVVAINEVPTSINVRSFDVVRAQISPQLEVSGD